MKVMKFCRIKRTKAFESLLPHDLVFLAFIDKNPLITRPDIIRLYKANGGAEISFSTVSLSINRLMKWGYITAVVKFRNKNKYMATAAGKNFLMGAERAIRGIKIDTLPMINYRLQKVKEYQKRKG
jgi:hypothetical protein